MTTDQATRAARLFDLLIVDMSGDDFAAMKMTMDDIRTDGLSTTALQASAALNARQDALDSGKSPVDAMDAGITAGLAARRR